MRDNDVKQRGSNELVCVWITVQDPDGRVHLESRWVVRDGAVTQPAA
jgi:hypothetical protein